MRGHAFSLPQLLIDSRLIGGMDEMWLLHEIRQLRRLLEGPAGLGMTAKARAGLE